MFDRQLESQVHIKAEQQPCKQGVRETSGLTDTQSEHPSLGACGWQETVELTVGGDEVGTAVTSSEHTGHWYSCSHPPVTLERVVVMTMSVC